MGIVNRVLTWLGIRHDNRLMPIEPTSERLFSVSEVAAILGVTDRRVIALIKSKHLPAERPQGRAWQIKESDIELVRERKPGNPKHRKNST